MKRRLAYGCCAAILMLSLACSGNNHQRAREKTEEAKRKTRQEAERARRELQKLGQEAKREASKVNQNVHQALQGGGTDNERTAAAGPNLNDAGRRLHTASE